MHCSKWVASIATAFIALPIISVTPLDPPPQAGRLVSAQHRRSVHQPVVPDQPEYSLDGIAIGIYNVGAWYAAATPKPAPPKPKPVARPTVAPSPRAYSSSPQFDDQAFYRVAQCETGGNWAHQTAFDGGLGILHANWTDLRTGNGYSSPMPELPEYGSQAPPALQIAAARRFIARYGIMGWGCHASFYG